MNDSANKRVSRRQALARTAQGSLGLGVLTTVSEVDAADSYDAVEITDFQRSCIRWRIDTTKKPVLTVSQKLPMTLNNVRAPLDARAVIRHKPTGQVFDYALSVSCKSEQVWVKRDVWHQPNADMCMIAGRNEFLVFKRWDKTDKGVMRNPASLGVQPERQIENPETSFDRFSVDLIKQRGRILQNVDAVIAALATSTPLVSQTEYETPEHHVSLEYPVKIVNFSEREKYYQVDTGPVLLPDFKPEYRSPLEGCRLAFVAHNSPEWAEFIVCVPTPLVEDLKVHHYSQVIRIEGVRNRMIAIV